MVQTVDSVYGTYDFAGFYDIPASGAILSGASITSKFMTLAYCASYCQGTEFFAVFAGMSDPVSLASNASTTARVIDYNLIKFRESMFLWYCGAFRVSR